MPRLNRVGLSRYLVALLVVSPMCSLPGSAVAAAPGAEHDSVDSERRTSRVGTSEELAFRQAKVIAEMNELEQRMFRLAESLKSMEPENSSRLMLGLKYAREELILHQMREAVKALSQLELAAAETQQQLLLDKLERLQLLLLSDDLDFELQLERLRQIREILRRLELAVRAEERLQDQSEQAAAAEQQAEQVESQLAKLEQLAQQQAGDLAALAKQRDGLQQQAEQLRQAGSQPELDAMQAAQQQNRSLSDEIAEMIRNLGANGTAAQGAMAEAGGQMQSAEGALGQGQPGTASSEQRAAAERLRQARQQMEQEAEQLLDRLRADVKLRVIEGLTLMLDKQQQIRTATELLIPGVAKGSRPAVSAALVLAQQEQELGLTASNLITLVQETEFGIALPAALWVVRDGMEDVQSALGKGHADRELIEDEQQIEADLAALLEAMKNLPTENSNSAAEGESGGSAEDQLRELNRLVAELKMIRMLQLRINRNTVDLDEERQLEAQRITTALRRRVLELQTLQEDVREVTEELSVQRGDEVR